MQIALTVVWVTGSVALLLYRLMQVIDPQGGHPIDFPGPARTAYRIALLALVFVAPIGLGLLARSPWLWVLYLFPHGVLAIILAVRTTRRLKNADDS
jgi:hypothetical protein